MADIGEDIKADAVKVEGGIKRHLPIILGGLVAAVVAVYLYLRSSGSGGSQATPSTTISQPPASGGGGSSGGGSSAPTSSAVAAWVDQTWTLTGNTTLDQLGQALTAAENAYGDALNSGNSSLAAALLPTLTAAQSAYNAAVSGVTAPPPPTTTPPPASTVANVSTTGVGGALTTIWQQFGFEETSNPTGYASGWASSLASLLNIPAGVANTAWNAINADPNNYVSQNGYVTAAQAQANIAALINGLIAQYNLTPSAFSNVILAPLNLGTKNPAGAPGVGGTAPATGVLPPGQTLTTKAPVYTGPPVPMIPLAKISLPSGLAKGIG